MVNTHDWVCDELNYARTKRKRAIALVDVAVDVGGTYQEHERIDLDTKKESLTLLKLSQAVSEWKREWGRRVKIRILPEDLGHTVRATVQTYWAGARKVSRGYAVARTKRAGADDVPGLSYRSAIAVIRKTAAADWSRTSPEIERIWGARCDRVGSGMLGRLMFKGHLVCLSVETRPTLSRSLGTADVGVTPAIRTKEGVVPAQISLHQGRER